MSVSLYPIERQTLKQIFDTLKEREPEIIEIPPNERKKVAEYNPFRHLLIIMNRDEYTVLYGAHEGEEYIPLEPGRIDIWRNHLFIINVNNEQKLISHADWEWELWVYNPNVLPVKIIVAEVS